MPRTLSNHIDSPRKVGDRLRQAREAAGLSQRQLAFPGCTAAYISRLEAGARIPTMQMIMNLAERLDVSMWWLANGKYTEAPTPNYSENFSRDVNDGEIVIALRLDVYTDDLPRFREALDELMPSKVGDRLYGSTVDALINIADPFGGSPGITERSEFPATRELPGIMFRLTTSADVNIEIPNKFLEPFLLRVLDDTTKLVAERLEEVIYGDWSEEYREALEARKSMLRQQEQQIEQALKHLQVPG